MVDGCYSHNVPRQTTAEIDAEIVDRAAALFSRHGFARTSLQQVADAVGYTKAGLLHHFTSKQAIHDAVVKAVLRQLAELGAKVDGLPAGVERDRAVISAIVDLTVASPGVSEFANTLVSGGQAIDPALEEAGIELLQAFGVDLNDLDDERLVRIVGACAGLTTTVLHAARADLIREWRGWIVAMAMNTLGHSATLPD